jgi:hypothetical protein
VVIGVHIVLNQAKNYVSMIIVTFVSIVLLHQVKEQNIGQKKIMYLQEMFLYQVETNLYLNAECVIIILSHHYQALQINVGAHIVLIRNFVKKNAIFVLKNLLLQTKKQNIGRMITF